VEQSTKKRVTSVAVSEISDLYLRTFSQFHFLTGAQLTRRLYKMGMLTTVKTRLKSLTDEGYLHAFWLPTVKSKSPYIYTLAAKGIKYLRAEGLDVEVSYRQSELEELSHSFLWHVLSLNDFIISAYLLERTQPTYRVHTMLHDLSLKKHPMEIPSTLLGEAKTNKPKLVVPDAFLNIRVTPGGGMKQRQYALWVELDRGTEQTIDHFKQKIRKIVAALRSNMAQDYFHVPRIAAVAFPTTAGQKRVEQMRKWSMEVLTELHVATEISDLFLFSPFTPALLPKQIFQEPVWTTPGQLLVTLLGE
jgi:Replication-relaxation